MNMFSVWHRMNLMSVHTFHVGPILQKNNQLFLYLNLNFLDRIQQRITLRVQLNLTLDFNLIFQLSYAGGKKENVNISWYLVFSQQIPTEKLFKWQIAWVPTVYIHIYIINLKYSIQMKDGTYKIVLCHWFIFMTEHKSWTSNHIILTWSLLMCHLHNLSTPTACILL
jgi:hypothetical protein